MSDACHVSLPEIVGKGYGEFWRSRKRYVAVKGSRASKKSKTAALWMIAKIIEYPLSNALVIRKTERTLRDSCFSDLRWASKRLGVERWWKSTTSPLQMEYIPTGQKIIFRGLDDPLKITSISVPVGHICFVWIEEAYEIAEEKDFDFIDESIRGELPEGLFKRINITFNPWNESHWLKARFFDNPGPDTLAMTTDYTCNEWLDKADLKLFEEMRVRNPRRYRVAALGDWGITEGLVFENWKAEDFRIEDLKGLEASCGLDFGWVDPLAFTVSFIDTVQKRIWVWDEIYRSALTNRKAYETICSMGYGKLLITADSAEPKSIAELRGYGLKVTPARKGRDSIKQGIRFLQDYQIIIHPRCVNFLTEIGNYSWRKDRSGKCLEEPEDTYNHLIDALRYSAERHMRRSKWLF